MFENQWLFYKHGAAAQKEFLHRLPWQQHHDDSKQNWTFEIFVSWQVCCKDKITCVLTWAWVCSNSSSFMLFDTGTWNTDMPATLLHSDRTLAMATMASSRVSRQLKAKLSNFSSKGYDGTSGWKPDQERKELVSCSYSRFFATLLPGLFLCPSSTRRRKALGTRLGFLPTVHCKQMSTRAWLRAYEIQEPEIWVYQDSCNLCISPTMLLLTEIRDYSQAMTSSKIYIQTSVRDHFFLLPW